jgi:hypothetical protein
MKLTEEDEPSLFLLGVELLDLAGQALFDALEKNLSPLFGDDWFSLTVVRTPDDRELAPRDLSVLLVQIEIRNNGNFRLALRTEYNNGKMHEKSYFDNLTDLRIIRNEWFHRVINPITTEELYDLCNTLIAVFPATTQISLTAQKIHEIIRRKNYSTADLLRTSKYIGSFISRTEELEAVEMKVQAIDGATFEVYAQEQSDMQNEIQKVYDQVIKEYQLYVPKIGDSYTGLLLPQKYSLKLDGTIIDRRAGIELSQKLGDVALTIGHSLLENHPTGGRLRLSAEGIVVGYENEEWVVIGNIDLNNWFDL